MVMKERAGDERKGGWSMHLPLDGSVRSASSMSNRKIATS